MRNILVASIKRVLCIYTQVSNTEITIVVLKEADVAFHELSKNKF